MCIYMSDVHIVRMCIYIGYMQLQHVSLGLVACHHVERYFISCVPFYLPLFVLSSCFVCVYMQWCFSHSLTLVPFVCSRTGLRNSSCVWVRLMASCLLVLTAAYVLRRAWCLLRTSCMKRKATQFARRICELTCMNLMHGGEWAICVCVCVCERERQREWHVATLGMTHLCYTRT